jgi:hypothetical protein
MEGKNGLAGRKNYFRRSQDMRVTVVIRAEGFDTQEPAFRRGSFRLFLTHGIF